MVDSPPFFLTWTAQGNSQPIEMRGGHGVWLESSRGEEWLDFGSLSYQLNLGYGHAAMVRAIQEQAARLCVSMPNAVFPEKTQLAEQLLRLAPAGFTKVFFTLGGSEANENAIKIAKLTTGRHKVISRYRSYHGATLGALTLTGDFRRPPLEPALAGVVHVLDSECARCPSGIRASSCNHEPITNVPRVLELEGPETVAAVFVEAVAGSNGVIIPPPRYLKRIREACDKHGVLLVCDEVLTGFGRTGRTFAFEHFDNVVPDMIVIGKAVTSGYAPLGAVLVHQRLADHFQDHVLYCGLTHYGHPLGIAAALQALKSYADEDLFARAAQFEGVVRAQLQALANRFPTRIRQTRCIGLLAAADIQADATEFAQLNAAIRKRNLLLHMRNDSRTMILAPPLCIEETEIEEGFQRISAALEEITP